MSPIFTPRLLSILTLTMASAPALAQMSWNLLSTPGPTARAHPVGAFNDLTGQGVLYGGRLGSGIGAGSSNQTWTWDGQWTLQAPAHTPTTRLYSAIAFDRARNRVVMFGGLIIGGTYTAETWLWDGTDWQMVQSQNSPSPRLQASLAYDPVHQVCVLFGGDDTNKLGDTWLWDGADWTQVFPAQSPPPRSAAGMAYDGTRSRIALVDGAGAPNTGGAWDDHWEWDGSNWSAVGGGPTSAGLYGATLYFDGSRNRLVRFAGQQYFTFQSNDTHEWDGSSWTAVSIASPPSARSWAAAFYDSWRGTGVVMGGWTGPSSWTGLPSNQTWLYSGSGPATVSNYGPGCAGANGTMAISVVQRPVIGTTYRIHVNNTDPNAFPWMITGLSMTLVNVGLIHLFGAEPGCFLQAMPDALDLVYGTNDYSLPIPNDPSLVGIAVHNQAIQFVLDINWNITSSSYSNAVRAQVGNS